MLSGYKESPASGLSGLAVSKDPLPDLQNQAALMRRRWYSP
jgi:hypothetical protein